MKYLNIRVFAFANNRHLKKEYINENNLTTIKKNKKFFKIHKHFFLVFILNYQISYILF